MGFEARFFKLRAFRGKCARSTRNTFAQKKMRAFNEKYARSEENTRVHQISAPRQNGKPIKLARNKKTYPHARIGFE